jgi:uncharacterized protein YjbI with pentapeptide repeats
MLQAHGAHSEVDFQYLLIKGLAIPEGYEFRDVDLSYTCFEDTEVKDCKFFNANLTHTIFPKVIGCEFQSCEMAPDGSNVLVTQLAEGQRVTVLQLPVVHQVTEHARAEASMDTPLAVG